MSQTSSTRACEKEHTATKCTVLRGRARACRPAATAATAADRTEKVMFVFIANGGERTSEGDCIKPLGLR